MYIISDMQVFVWPRVWTRHQEVHQACKRYCLKPHLHDTTGCQTRCQTGCQIGLTTGIVYTAGCQTGRTTQFDNRLKEQLFVQHGCQTGCQTRLTTGCTGLTTGWMFVYTVQPVVKPAVQLVWQPAVSCKRDIRNINQSFTASQLPGCCQRFKFPSMIWHGWETWRTSSWSNICKILFGGMVQQKRRSHRSKRNWSWQALPVAVEDGKEGKTVAPRLSEVADTHVRVTSDHATTPDQQRLTRRDTAVVATHQHVRYLPHTHIVTPYEALNMSQPLSTHFHHCSLAHSWLITHFLLHKPSPP